MNLIQAVYGMQYDELERKGYDVNKGRFYGNLLIAITILIYLFVIFVACNLFIDNFSDVITRMLRKIFGYSTGKTIGRIIVIPIVFLIYLPVSFIFGSKSYYEKSKKAFVRATKEEREAVLGKMLGIFFLGLGLLLVLSIAGLFV